MEEREGSKSLLLMNRREDQREKSEEEIETERGTETAIGSVVTEIKTGTGTEKGGGIETVTEIVSISVTGATASAERIDTALCFPLWVRTKAWGTEKKGTGLSHRRWKKVHRMG